ncbi:MAG: flagellar M-ring protein FliF [Lachnospiraceae bacterium]|nr:flagellar M-ring protein FliF [Lachnospiraceae bacterium]
MADNLQERLKALPAQIMMWWNKFTSKQKTLIICVSAGVILTLVILVTVLAQPKYVLLADCDSTKEASAIVDLLESAGYDYLTTDDGLQISILAEQEGEASLLLGANDIPTTTYDLENVFSGGFSTTQSDIQKRYKLYLESRLEEHLVSNTYIESAQVTLTIPEDDGTLLKESEESYASVVLHLKEELPENAAAGLARFVATGLGNDTTDNIVIIDTEGNILFSGEDESSMTGNASNQLTLKQQAENLVKSEVKKVLIGTGQYDAVEVASNLVLDFSVTELTDHRYTPADGATQGVLAHEEVYESESTGTVGGVPGTTSNGEDGTTYAIEDYDESSSTTSERSSDYLPNETITSKTVPAGAIKYNESSTAISAKRFRVIKEEEAERQGLLDGITWEEYKAANSETIRLEVDEDVINLVANATGIAVEDISFVAYEEPMFIDKEGLGIEATDVIQIVLIILIVGLLAFVLLRSMRADNTEEVAEELSVEKLLQSTPEPELEDIEVEVKSETRKMIEKFVDENPEAVANLLRNWLNEDWG